MDFERRVAGLREGLPNTGADALLVTNLTNVQYLCGFTGTNGQLFISHEKCVFLTDPRYEARAGSLVLGADIAIYPARLIEGLAPLIEGAGNLAVEANTMTIADRDQLQGQLGGIALVPVTGSVEALRRTKDLAEVDALRRAVSLADRAFDWILDRIVPGVTEREIALALEMQMRGWGAEAVSFPPIVGSGPLSAHIHHSPSDREFQKGDLILLDFGCRLDGYCSDMTRTVVLGAATDEQRERYDLVLRAQTAGIGDIRPGRAAAEVDRVARDLIDSGGFGDRFGHGLGHGIGLDIHEDPRLKKISEDVLLAGDVVTVEPGVYVQGSGGIRIEDCILVTEDGSEVLGSSRKDELIEL